MFGRKERGIVHVLVVEDEPLVAFDNEVMMTNAGYTVVATVDSVGDALAILNRAKEGRVEEGATGDCGVDLILTDLNLTGLRSGMDLAEEAKRLGVPVLFATANPPAGGERLALGVLLKPYSERTLKAALKAVGRLLAGKKRVKVPDGVILYDAPLAA